ncbi:hypothetical protein O181_043664 [Austropuccinia psidii MF-1]|uniref:Uncharacterized protein n=1 Tax=Austropuccinia psidii MF-1 TaxID=1389203 RepID=A0A9Q3HIM8_9BASI|nr:hypothetical protein [Austropuccinia psidii MF-1]
MNSSPYSYNPSDFGYNNLFPQSSHENGVENLRKTILAKDEIIEKLMKKVEGLEVTFASQKQPKSKVSQQEKRNSSKKGKNQADSKNAQKGKKVSPSPKRSPYQMLTSEVPEDFHFTKEALFIHIKVLWGMLEKQCVPPSLDHTLLKEFFEWFTIMIRFKMLLALYRTTMFKLYTKNVAFIPTSNFQMSQQVNSDEFLGDRTFNQNNWDIVMQPYGLSHEIAKSSDEDEDSEESQRNEFSDGDVIDMQESNNDSMEDADS